MVLHAYELVVVVAQTFEAIPSPDVAATVADITTPTNAPSTTENQNSVGAIVNAAAEKNKPVDPNPSTQVLVDSTLFFL